MNTLIQRYLLVQSYPKHLPALGQTEIEFDLFVLQTFKSDKSAFLQLEFDYCA